MRLFEFRTSSARWVRGRLIYTPLPPAPRWQRIAYALVPLFLVVLSAAEYGSEPAKVAALAAVCAAAAGVTWSSRRRRPVRPTDPLEVGDALIARVRRLVETGRVGDAMLAVEAELTVNLTDAKLIVDAVQRRIGHERAEALEGR